MLDLGTLEEREREAIFWFEMKMDEEQRFLGLERKKLAENFVRMKIWMQESVKSPTEALSAIYSD